MKDKLFINDFSFSHSHSSSWYHKPEKFEWVRGNCDSFDTVFTTDLLNVDNFTGKKVYGWLIEPPDLIPKQYEYAINNQNKFYKIFTYDKNLLNISDKFEFLPIGGCWIEKEERKIYQKTKFISTIVSTKTQLTGHKLRHEVAEKIEKIDLFGSMYNKLPKKIDALKEYMFSIVIENQKMDYLFTEKIIDCFATGTIPIYWGCPSISDFFDIKGIITFNDIDELKKIIENINKDYYFDNIEAIRNNFIKFNKYSIADDIIYNKILKNK